MGEPANLPDFETLAREIAETNLPWDKSRWENALDAYLGKAEKLGVKVQERARQLLSRGTRHTSLHEHLLGLFSRADAVRLITTNFDALFASAASAVFNGQQPRPYVGPTLPPGRDFRGIAQIHGSLTDSSDRLVLTDADFGFAYMADGWATRFLVGALGSSTVLFVGYRLGDPVLQYLVKALPLQGKSFALCKQHEAERWRDHGIEPVVFADAAGPNPYADLHEGMRAWASYALSTRSDHDARMQWTMASGVPASEQEADYIRTRLATVEGRESFWRYATAPEWLEWVSSFGLIDALAAHGPTTPEILDWAHWIASNFISGDSPAFLRWIIHRRLPIHTALRRAITAEFSRCQQLPGKGALRQLVAIIVSDDTPDISHTPYTCYLLGRLAKNDCQEESLALLRWITRVHLLPTERYFDLDSGDSDTLRSLSNRVGLNVDVSDLDHTLSKEGPRLIAAMPRGVLTLAVQRITEAYELIDLARAEDSRFDWLSFGRTAISETGQDRFRNAEDILVCLARDALKALGTIDPGFASRFLDEYLQPGSPALLRRLALNHLAQWPATRSDDALVRLGALDWLIDIMVRPEVYECIRAHFPVASEQARSAFVVQMGAMMPKENDATSRRRIAALLLHVAPFSDAAQEFARASDVALTEVDNADTDGYLSRFDVGSPLDSPSPVEATELIKWDASEALAKMKAVINGSNDLQVHPQPLLGAAQQVSQSHPDWAVAVIAAVVKEAAWVQDPVAEQLIEAIAWGLHSGIPTGSVEESLLSVAAAHSWPERILKPLAFTVETWSRRLSKEDSRDKLRLYLSAADALFDQSGSISSQVGDGDQFVRAINHPAGKAAEVWLRIANLGNWNQGQFTPSATPDELTRWDRLLARAEPQARFAAPILGTATERLVAADLPWTRAHLFPAFSLDHGVSAGELWSGRLLAHNWSDESLSALQPHLVGLFKNHASLVPERDEQIGDLVAFHVAKSPPNAPFERSILRAFAASASEEALTAFSRQLPTHLLKLSVEARQSTWDDVLRPFIADRRTNVPRAFYPRELGSLLRLLFVLDGREDDFLTEAELCTGITLERADGLVYELSQESAWTDAHPSETLRLIALMARSGAIPSWSSDETCQLIERAAAVGSPRELVIATAEAVAATTGAPCAMRIAQRFKASP